MLHKLSRQGRVDADAAQVSAIVAAHSGGLKRLLAAALQTQARALGIPGDILPAQPPPPEPQITPRGVTLFTGLGPTHLYGELLVGKDQIIAIALTPGEKTGARCRLELSLFAAQPSTPEFETLCDAIIEAFGVKLQFMVRPSLRFAELRDDGMTASTMPDDAEQRAARALASPTARQLAIAIKASTQILVDDLPKQVRGVSDDDLAKALVTLASVGLVESEYVVICSDTKARVLRVPGPDDLADLTGRGFRCACGKPIGDETVQTAMATTPLGDRMLDGSRWMSVILLAALVERGIPVSRIMIEQTSGSEEFDCIADLGGHLALFELKDKEFSIGNAYSFGAKIGLVRPDEAFVVTTAKVGNDVRDHFAKSAQARRTTRTAFIGGADDRAAPVTYIEGLDALGPALDDCITIVRRSDLRAALSSLLPIASLSTDTVMNAFQQFGRDA